MPWNPRVRNVLTLSGDKGILSSVNTNYEGM